MRKFMTYFISTVFLLSCQVNPAFADAVIFSGADVKTLKPNIDLFGQSKILSGNANPQSTATSAPIGSLYLNTVTGDIYKKIDSGSSTNWTKLGSDQGSFGSNYVKNPFATANVSDVTASGGSLTRNTTNPLLATADFLIDASASSQTFKWDTFTFDRFLDGGNCQMDFFYKGDGSLYKAYIEIDGVRVSNELTMSNTGTNSQLVSIIYPCGASTGVKKPVIESTGDGAAIQVVGMTTGKFLSSSVAQAYFFGGQEQVGASTCGYSQNTSSGLSNYVDLGAGSGCSAWTTSGKVTSVGTNSHQFSISNMETGQYLIQYIGYFFNTLTGGTCNIRLSDGTNTYQPQTIVSGGGQVTVPLLSFHVSKTSVSSPTYKLQAADDGATNCGIANQANFNLAIKVWRFPSSTEVTQQVNAVPAFWTGYHDSTCGGWSRSNTAYGDFSADASCALVQVESKNISCVATGGVLPAIACTFPKPGDYTVCAQIPFTLSTGSGSSTQITDGTTARTWAAASITGTNPQTLCGTWNVLGTTKTFTVQGKMGSGTMTLDGQGATGVITWNVWAQSQGLPAPYFVGSVNQGGTATNTTIDAEINCDAASAITSQNFGISAVGNRSTTSCALTIATGVFSAAPYRCLVTTKATTVQATSCNCTSATSCTIYGANADYDAYVSIMGQK